MWYLCPNRQHQMTAHDAQWATSRHAPTGKILPESRARE